VTLGATAPAVVPPLWYTPPVPTTHAVVPSPVPGSRRRPGPPGGAVGAAGGGRWAVRWRRALPGLLIALACAAVYAPAPRGAFVLDDLEAVVRNGSIRRLATALSPPTNTLVAGRPVLNLSFAICYAVGRLDPLAYRVGNVLVHLGAALLLLGVVRRTLELPTLPPSVREHARGMALAAALLWAVHPLTTAAVSYTVQRAESLAAFWLLLVLYAVLRSATARRGRGWGALAVLACAAGMGTKETMAAAPLLALLYDRTFLAGSFAAAWRRRRGLYLGLAATWALLAWSVAATAGRGGSVTMTATLSPLHYAMTQCQWLVRYLALVLWPHPLVFDYGLPDAGVPILRSFAAWLPWGAALAVLAGAAVALWRRTPAAGFPLAVAAGVLAPSSSVVPVITEVAAEHRAYLPAAAVILLLVVGVGAVLRLLGVELSAPRVRAALRAAVAVLVVGAGVLAALRNLDYRSAEGLWRDTVAKRPDNARAHLNLGLELASRGDLAGAAASFERAATIKPDYVEAWVNLGRMQAELGQHQRAIELYDRALAIQPDFQPAVYNRGLAWMARGDTARAVADFERAMTLDPRDPDPLVARGLIKGQRGDLAGAIEDFSRAIAVSPLAADAYRNRAVAYFERQQFDRALDDLEVAERLGARIDPRFVDALARALTARQ